MLPIIAGLWQHYGISISNTLEILQSCANKPWIYILSGLTNVHYVQYFDGLVQDCSNSIANALELLQSCAKPSICIVILMTWCMNVLSPWSLPWRY